MTTSRGSRGMGPPTELVLNVAWRYCLSWYCYAGRTRRKKGTLMDLGGHGEVFCCFFFMVSFWCFEIFATGCTGVQKDRINIFDAYSHLFISLAGVTRIHKLSGQWISITRTGGIIQPWFSKSGGSGDGSLVHGRSSPAPEGEGMAPVCEGMDPNVRLWSILEVIHPLPISFSCNTQKKHSNTARNSCHAFLVRQSPSWLVGNFNPSEKYESQLGLLFPIYIYIWKNKSHVPNHQSPWCLWDWSCLSAAQLSQRIDGNQMSLPSESSRSLAARSRTRLGNSARHQLVLLSTFTGLV